MKHLTSTALAKFLGVVMVVAGLTAPALGQPPTGPLNDHNEIQATLADILTVLDNLQTDVSNLQTNVDNLSNEVDFLGNPQSWDKKLDSTNGEANGCNSDRFTCIWGNTAVRDNETGLVWEAAPGVNANNLGQQGVDTVDWYSAIKHCARKAVGGRKGWHLPYQEQLASLVDTTNNNLALPTSHPFKAVQSAEYWSATTAPDLQHFAWLVVFSPENSLVSPLNIFDKSFIEGFYAWCVHGGQGFDGNTHETLH